MRRSLLFGALASLSLACTQGPEVFVAPSQIVGGTETKVGEFEAVVALSISNTQGFFICTGTLVDPEFVLTAAHCVAEGGTRASGVRIIFGKTNSIADADQVVDVDKIFFSPIFNINNLTAGNDVAILHLAEPVTDVEPIPFNTEELTDDFIGRQFTAVGYGNTDFNNGTAGTKRFVDLTIDQIDPQLIFYGDNSQNICGGDSGGPDILEFADGPRVIGIHSFGFAPFCHAPSGSQRTDSQFANFLDPIVNSAFLPEPPRFLFDGFCDRFGGSADPDCRCTRDGFCDEQCPNIIGAKDADCTEVAVGGCTVSNPEEDSTPFIFLGFSLLGLFFLGARNKYRG